MTITAAQKIAFTHKPKKLDQAIYVGFSGLLFNAIWDAARAQDWFGDNVAYVGNHKGEHFFQISGHADGFARMVL